MERYIAERTIRSALTRMFGTADHLLKIWFTLKQMGFGEGKPPVLVTTSSPNEALRRLYAFGSPAGKLLVPFAHTQRFLTMEADAGRSIIQTNIQRWKSSGSVVTCDPTAFLDIQLNPNQQLLVAPTRSYPLGLGVGRNGFAREEGERVCIPDVSFAVWYFRQSTIPVDQTGVVERSALANALRTALGLSAAEFAAIFITDNLEVETCDSPISNEGLHEICSSFVETPGHPITVVQRESFEEHSLRIRSMKTVDSQPAWLKRSPREILEESLEAGALAVLLYGPPRTGKTRAIDAFIPRADPRRETIQMHDGWGYDHLIEGFRPNEAGQWSWVDGPLKQALESGKQYIVLEEINRTDFAQALGEVFSLIEEGYRGEQNSIRLRSGKALFIPQETVFLMAMNNLDKSTEDIDDAMMGRFAAVAFPPRVEDLAEMLASRGFEESAAAKVRELFVFILEHYPLGHGYFAELQPKMRFIQFYLTRVRPVLENHFRNYRPETLALIDNKVDALFAS